MAVYVAWIGETSNAYISLVRKLLKSTHLESQRIQEKNTKWNDLVQDWVQLQASLTRE
jgi:hypothetical protein